MSFKVAIIGRPNVGKSTLFNRLAGKKLALVDDTPGVTRDRRVHPAKLYDLSFEVIDTAGFETAAPETLQGRMREQTDIAIREADLVDIPDGCPCRPAARRQDLRRHRPQVRQAGRACRQQIRIARRRDGNPGSLGSRAGRTRGDFRRARARACRTCATLSSPRLARRAAFRTSRRRTTSLPKATC